MMRYSNVQVQIEIIVATPDDVEPTIDDAKELLKCIPIWHYTDNFSIVHSVIETNDPKIQN